MNEEYVIRILQEEMDICSHGTDLVLKIENFDIVAERIVKLCNLYDVSNNKVAVCDICENDKGLETYTLCHRCWDVANHH